LFPLSTDVTIHFSHGIFQTIVLENNETHECFSVALSPEDISLSDVTVTYQPVQLPDRHSQYYGRRGFELPIITAKIASTTEQAPAPTVWRSPVVEGAMRGEHRASALLETMPALRRRFPDAVSPNRARADGSRLRVRSTSTHDEGTAQFNEGDTVFRWLSNSDFVELAPRTGRILNTGVSLPSNMQILCDHPQYLTHRAGT
jgi:hypothetical protein